MSKKIVEIDRDGEKKPQNRMEEYAEAVKGLQDDRSKVGILMNPHVETNVLLHELNKSAALIVDELALLINTMLADRRKDTER